MIRLRPSGFGETSARLRLSGFALRAWADGSGFGEALPSLWRGRGGGGAVAAQLRRRAITTAIAIMIGGSSSVLACPVCFGAEETPLIDGAKLGILVMLGITFAVQGAFVGFFLYLRNRAKRIAEVELDTEWSELQRGSRTS
jgi:hypothetical protein